MRTLTVGGLERTYILHIPPGLSTKHPAPVVFVFHGTPQTAQDIQKVTGFNDISDKNGFILVYPNGIDKEWNIGGGLETNIDDFAFIRQILVDVGTVTQVDPKRIYATGFSDGAIFSYRIACEMSDTFAAIAPVEGWMVTNPCQPKEPVAMMDVHGSNDSYEGKTVVSYQNGVPIDIVFPPVEQTIATWAQLDGCTGDAQVEILGSVTHTTHDSCQGGTTVELVLIKAGGHSWPDLYGFSTINSQVIWDFLKAHSKP